MNKLYKNFILEILDNTENLVNFYWIFEELIEEILFQTVIDKVEDLNMAHNLNIKVELCDTVLFDDKNLYLTLDVIVNNELELFYLAEIFDFCKRTKDNEYTCYKLLIKDYEDKIKQEEVI